MNRNERLITRKILEAAAAAGWTVTSLDDGDEDTKTNDPEQIILLACNLDECFIYLNKGKEGAYVRLIFDNGNDGFDVISDHTTNLEFMEQVVAPYIDWLEDAYHGAENYKASNFASRTQYDRTDYYAPQLRDVLSKLVQFVDRTGVLHNPALAGMNTEDLDQARLLVDLTDPVDLNTLTFYPGCDDRKKAA